ncbi:myeloid differentiation primary response protein MyD88 [Fopius arisanus]|uniref:Myeloid differentiation primary response protein MyD88 n=1 Tax=Fopius arisanus TaxID=64838 RepID=A0A9R1U6G9_9HYME|nr:PREDICTED: myeloid differentiation primary response protein MyD88 [Fopius arisanus]
MVNFGCIPLIAMSPAAKNIFSTLLNPPKVLQTCDKSFRDWRGFADVLGITGDANGIITSSLDPTAAIFDILKTRKERVTFEHLVKALEKIDRWDVLDDASDILEKDGKVYLERLEKVNAPEVDAMIDSKMLTYDDVVRLESGQPMQTYDAFLLFAEEDSSFADEIIENLERRGNLRLCTRDRDLISRGERFEPEVLMELISERCTRLIVVLSPNFIKSPVNTFLMDFGQTTGLHERRRKIVPVLYQDCKIPIQMRHTVMLHYNRMGMYNFWERFRNCIRTVSPAVVCDSRNYPSREEVPSRVPSIVPEMCPEADGEVLDEITPGGAPGQVTPRKKSFFRFAKRKNEKRDDSVVQLPSLSGLDDLGEINTQEMVRKPRGTGVAKKIKALVLRS